MKSAIQFWDVIGIYNQKTIIVQVIIAAFLLALILLVFLNGKKIYQSILKVILFLSFEWIGIIFFCLIDKSIIGLFFAAPLFILAGLLFLIDVFQGKIVFEMPDEKWRKVASVSFLLLYLLYPIISFMLGHNFPKIVTLVMPCPLVVLAMTLITSTKGRIDKKIFILLLVWALTGFPKSIMFSVFEDLILFASGLFGVISFVTIAKKNKHKVDSAHSAL